MTNYPILIFTTFSSEEESEKITKTLFEKKLIACCQRTQVQSSYIWQGQIQKDSEVAVKLMTVESKKSDIEGIVRQMHSYDTFQFVVCRADYVEQKYFEWIEESLK